jgi:drug/metabolite transporter (DMT)-like permease
MGALARYGTVIAFLGIVVFGGLNGVAIRFSNRELAPMWGGTLRFALAALVLFGVVAVRRIPLPRGAALRGSLLYGAVGFAATFGLAYWALTQISAGIGQTILSIVPLLTLLLAAGLGMERLRLRNLLGALLALAGIAVIFSERLGAAVSVLPLLAVVGAAGCMATSNVIVKRSPRCHPLANNAIAMATGAAILLAVSLLAGEPRPLPSQTPTWIAVLYVSVIGSAVVFSLFMFVIERWTASSTSYAMLLMPLVTVAAGAVIAGEAIAPVFVLGGLLVLAGVYVGILAGHRLRLPSPPPLAPATAASGPGPITSLPGASLPGAALPAASVPMTSVPMGVAPSQPIVAQPGCA